MFGQAIAKGRTAGVFADGMTEPCAPRDEGTEGGDEYVVHHNPWVYFRAEHADCMRYDQPVAALDAAIRTGRLPNAGMVVPNQCHNAHDCDLSQADAWFAGYMRKIFAGPDWRSGHLAVVLTADEDDHSQDNKILTVVVHPSQHAHVVRDTTRPLFADPAVRGRRPRTAPVPRGGRRLDVRRLRAAGGLSGSVVSASRTLHPRPRTSHDAIAQVSGRLPTMVRSSSSGLAAVHVGVELVALELQLAHPALHHVADAHDAGEPAVARPRGRAGTAARSSPPSAR